MDLELDRDGYPFESWLTIDGRINNRTNKLKFKISMFMYLLKDPRH